MFDLKIATHYIFHTQQTTLKLSKMPQSFVIVEFMSDAQKCKFSKPGTTSKHGYE